MPPKQPKVNAARFVFSTFTRLTTYATKNMRLKNTACPRCKQELTPSFKDMLPQYPRHRHRHCCHYWFCPHCGEEIYIDALSSTIILLAISGISYSCFYLTLAFMELFHNPLIPLGYWLIAGGVWLTTLFGAMIGLYILYYWYFYSRRFVN